MCGHLVVYSYHLSTYWVTPFLLVVQYRCHPTGDSTRHPYWCLRVKQRVRYYTFDRLLNVNLFLYSWRYRHKQRSVPIRVLSPLRQSLGTDGEVKHTDSLSFVTTDFYTRQERFDWTLRFYTLETLSRSLSLLLSSIERPDPIDRRGKLSFW